MRKFYAAIALCITLIGTFAPVVFSVSLVNSTPKINIQKNTVSADVVDVSFGGPISIIESPGKPDYYKLETTIRYDSPTRGTGSPFNNVSFFGTFAGSLDPHYTVVNTTTNTTIIDEQVTSPQNLGLKDATWGPMRQEIQITTPGKYEAWFYEDYVTGNNLLSSKIKFEITGNKKVVNAQISSQTGNIRGDDQITFSPITGNIDSATPDKANFTVGVTYKNTNKQATDDSEEDLYWVLKDEAGAFILESPINLTSKPKYNTEREVTVQITNLQVGKKYKMNFIEKGILDTQGNPKRTQEFPFTAGTPIDNDAVQQQIQQQNADAAQQALDDLESAEGDSSNAGFSCEHWYNFRCNLTIVLIDLLTFVPNFIAIVTGISADFMLSISINPATYGLPGSGIESGIRDAWKIVRDFSNILFIFSLFVSAFMLILNKTDINGKFFDPKKTVVRVVIMALLVNFSLLFCRIIIQTADLFSNILYNKIGTTDYSKSGNTTVKSVAQLYNSLKIKSISLPLIDQSDPQNLFLDAGITQDTQGSFTAYLMIGFLIFFVLLIFIWTFGSMLFIFLGRILGLWIGMILSPIAFVSWSIPFIENDDLIGFNNWLKNFVQLAFMTPVYLFFIYITVTILNIEGFSKLTNTGNDVQSGGWIFNVIKIALTVLIPLLLSCFMLIQGKKISYKMSGKIGEMVGKYSSMVTTAALGAATGGTAMLGRQTLGHAGSALANANRGDNSFLGKGMRNMGDKLGAASFDVRKNERAMKGFGKFTEMSGEKIDLGTRGLREGGFTAEGTLSEQYRKRQERIAKEREEKLKKEAADALLNAQAKDAQELRENQAKLEAAQKAKEAEDAKITMEAENQGPEAFIEKKEKEKEALQNQNIQLNVEKLTVESEKTTLNTEKADIENDLNNLETEKTVIEKDIQQLEAAAAVETDPDKKANIEAAVNFQKEDLAKKTTEIDNKKVELQNKNIQIQDRDKTIAEKDKEIKKNDEEIKKADTYQNNLTGITSVRDARQKKTDLELEATHSQEKAAMDKNKTDMDEKKTKADEAQRELNALNKKLENEKDKNSAKALEIKADIAKQTTERDNKDNDYKTAKTEFEKHKKAYSDAYGDKIKALADFEKEALSSYEKDHEVQIRRATAVNGIIDAQKKVNASQNNLDNINYQNQQQFANDLEKSAQTNQEIAGSWAEHIGTISGGRVMGGSVRNSNENGATGARRNASSNF